MSLRRSDALLCPHCLRGLVFFRYAPRSGDGFLRCPVPACERHCFYVAVPADESYPLLGWGPVDHRTWLVVEVTAAQRRTLEGQTPAMVLTALRLLTALAA